MHAPRMTDVTSSPARPDARRPGPVPSPHGGAALGVVDGRARHGWRRERFL